METFEFYVKDTLVVCQIKKEVPFEDLLSAIREGVDLCYADDTLQPELIEYAIKYEQLKATTDCVLPEDAEGVYQYIRGIQTIPSADAEFIAQGIHARIDYKVKMTMAILQSSGTDRIVDLVEDASDKFNAFLDNLSRLCNYFLNDAEKYKDVDLGSLATAIAKMNVPEKELAKQVLDYQSAKKRNAKSSVQRTPKKAT